MHVGERDKDNKIMKRIIPRKTIFKKILPTSFILAILGFGLFSYDNNKDFINNFQSYHLASYTTLFSNIVFASSDSGNLSSVLGTFTGNKNAEDLNTEIMLANSVPVLVYHGIVSGDDPSNVSLKNFKDQMFALKKAGWQTITLDNFYAFIHNGKDLPDKSFLLTFDDGRKDSYYPVDPILKALDYNAVIFVITKYSLEDKSNNYYLSKNELKRMSESGRWEIEAHTREGHNIYKIAQNGKQGHYYSNKLWLDNENRSETEEEFTNRIKSDFTIAKNDIEQGLDTKVISFAFPFGDFGQNTVNFPEAEPIILEAVKSVYSMAFYQIWPGKGYIFNYPDQNQVLIKRIDVKSSWSADNLLKILDIAREKPLPYLDNFSDYNGWVKTWGQLTLSSNSMILDSDISTTGSSAFLDGSYLWDNYSYSANINLVKGRNISLLARYKDDENYAACNFSGDNVRIEQRLNKKNIVMVEVKNYINFSKKDLNLGIRVDKDKIKCLVNGNIIAYTHYLSPVLSNGGIGFKTWDPQMNNSELIVKNISVEKIK